MSLITKQKYRHIATFYHKCQLQLLHSLVTLSNYAESRTLLKSIKWTLKVCLNILHRICRTLYWLLAPNMLYKLALRHMILFCIMFAIPPTIRGTIKPLWRFFRYRILLPFFMGRKWVRKYLDIKRQCHKDSTTYDEYAEHGIKLDDMDGYDAWRLSKQSTLYSYNRIHQDLMKLVELNQRCDDCAVISAPSAASTPLYDLMQFVKSRIERNYCGITNPQLYSLTTVGTKKLIEDFIDTMCQTLHNIETFHDDAISLEDKIIYFQELRHALGRTALCLSGGGALGYYHIGVVFAMARNNLLPKIVTGSSAGAYMAALTCCKHQDELTDVSIKRVCLKIYKEKEHRTWCTVFSVRCKRFWKTGYFLDSNVFRSYLRESLGDMTFLESFKKTGRILNISVSGSDGQTMPRLLNFLSSPNVVIWSAVLASTSIPILFEPQQLYIKTGKKLKPIYLEGIKFSDGSITHDLPMHKIAHLFNVDNFIVSQVNPHMVPFLFHSIVAPIPLFEKLFTFLAKEFHFYLSTILTNVGGFRVFNDMLTQRWTGDVTIVPDIPPIDLINCLKNPTEDYVKRVSEAGAKTTFKHISRLQALCAVEFTVDQCLRNLRSQYSEYTLNQSAAISFNKLSRIASFQTPTKMKSFDFVQK